MTIGPVEYAVFAFPGNRFTGEIAPAIADLVEAGTIRIIDLAFVIKDADGSIAAMEISELGEAAAAFEAAGAAPGGLLNEEDLVAAGEELGPNSSAALFVWEDVWATRLAEAIRDSGGEVLDHDRLPHEVVQAALDYASTVS
jgi:hypothetical protein